MWKPSKENGEALKVSLSEKILSDIKKKWINWWISIHYEYFIDKKNDFLLRPLNFINYVKEEGYFRCFKTISEIKGLKIQNIKSKKLG